MHLWVKKDVIRQIKILLLFIPLLIISDHSLAKQQQKLLVLGDSLSAAYGLTQQQGWVSLLQNAWQDKCIIVVNAAISGETTDGGLSRLPRLLEQHNPSHLYIELGGNDGLQGHPVNKMQANIQAMIDLAQQKGIKVVLQKMQIPTNFGRRYTQLFSKMYDQLAEENAVPVVPFFLAEIALDKKLMQRDGIHPTAEAQPMIADYMQQQLSKHLNK